MVQGNYKKTFYVKKAQIMRDLVVKIDEGQLI